MSYPATYSYSSSSGWMFDIQAGSSSNSNATNEWPQWDPSGISSADYFDFLMKSHYDLPVPISRYSTLAGALGPVDPNPQGDGARPTPAQSVIPQPVAPPHLGVQAQNVAPPSAVKTKRRAYVLANPPARHRRVPVGTIQFCCVQGCKQWTTDRGKKLARHRATHFPGMVGVACPRCKEVFSRSSLCGKHLRTCDPQAWSDFAARKGTQDAWGDRVGQDLVEESLVDGADFSPRPRQRL